LQAPDLTSNYWFFDFHQNGQIANLQDYLSVAQALKFVSSADASAKLLPLQTSSPLGPVSLYIDSQYCKALFKTLFVDAQGNARPQQWYEGLGRNVMISLTEPGTPISDAHWGTGKSGTSCATPGPRTSPRFWKGADSSPTRFPLSTVTTSPFVGGRAPCTRWETRWRSCLPSWPRLTCERHES
jgi:hypothetical protein